MGKPFCRTPGKSHVLNVYKSLVQVQADSAGSIVNQLDPPGYKIFALNVLSVISGLQL